MADHIHKQIRDAAAARISEAMPGGPSVLPGRVWPLGAQHLPCITIHTPEDRWEAIFDGAENHSLTLVVMIWARDLPSTGVNDALDTIAVPVLAALAADYTLGGLAISGIESTGSKLEPVTLGQDACGALGLTYLVRYATPRGAADHFL